MLWISSLSKIPRGKIQVSPSLRHSRCSWPRSFSHPFPLTIRMVHDKFVFPCQTHPVSFSPYIMLQVQYRISFISFFLIRIRCMNAPFLQLYSPSKRIYRCWPFLRNILCQNKSRFFSCLKSIDRNKTPINSALDCRSDTVLSQIIMHPPVKILNFRKNPPCPSGIRFITLICKISPKSTTCTIFAGAYR